MPKQEERILDPTEGLLRNGWRLSPKRFRVIVDQMTGQPRAPTAVFEPRAPDPGKPTGTVDEALSDNVESSLLAASLELTWGTDQKKQYTARITVRDCHANDLEAYRDPVPNNPHHASIWDLVALRFGDPDRYERTIGALARASTILGLP